MLLKNYEYISVSLSASACFIVFPEGILRIQIITVIADRFEYWSEHRVWLI